MSGFNSKREAAADKLQEPVREALKLALITLEGWDNHDKWVWPETALEQAKRNTKEAITAIKEALAQPAQESYDQTALELCNVCGWKTLIPDDGCLNCERAQPAQEPVAFDAFLESEDFYELMQAYRHFPIDALVQFEAVKDALRTAHNVKERNFCPRCGKRTNDIHTCTPPQGDA